MKLSHAKVPFYIRSASLFATCFILNSLWNHFGEMHPRDISAFKGNTSHVLLHSHLFLGDFVRSSSSFLTLPNHFPYGSPSKCALDWFPSYVKEMHIIGLFATASEWPKAVFVIKPASTSTKTWRFWWEGWISFTKECGWCMLSRANYKIRKQ